MVSVTTSAADRSWGWKMAKSSTGWIILLFALAEFSAALPSSLSESIRLKRQYGCDTCGSYGYGHGLGRVFYGQYGGGYNNNYGGTNIGSINVENVSG
uniref:Glycine rich protein n=1 Tax=Ascaris lumbricoides TaxID=6252 RepID=A0A0M3I4L7_ASCLU